LRHQACGDEASFERSRAMKDFAKLNTIETDLLSEAELLHVTGGNFLVQEMMASLKLINEILSNVSKTRSEISMTFARNSRA
jgi:hypothetical protein